MLPGRILAKSLSTPRCPGIDGAYYGKILIYATISRYRRGLLRQNPYLCPDIPVSTGLITAKSLSVPRWHDNAGAYSSKILIYATISRYRRGLLRQNLFLRPDVPVSTGLITAKSLSTPRYPASDGAYYGKIPFCAPMYKGGGYNRPDFVSYTRFRKFCWVQIACF